MTQIFGELSICYPPVLVGSFVLWSIVIFLKIRQAKKVYYAWPLSKFLASKGFGLQSKKPWIIFIFSALGGLISAFLASRIVSTKHEPNLFIDAVDIILALDASGSMGCYDNPGADSRSRFQVAREVALDFVKKRKNDQIGLINFATEAITRAPLTLDKSVLEFCLMEMEIGQIDENKTNIAAALGLALARLSGSSAKTKIIILLTDGRPNVAPKDLSIEKAVSIAKDRGVKIYTIGIGSMSNVAYIQDPVTKQWAYGQVEQVDPDLLSSIAKNTGGKSFFAHNSKELEEAYNQIDRLEKTKVKTPFLSSHKDLFWPLALPLLFCLSVEGLLSLFWRGLW